MGLPGKHAKASPDAVAMLLLLLFAAALWAPALSTPFWGDDYFYLYNAHAANVGGESWWHTFWPRQPLQFWRPLSQEAYWRVVDSVLGADVLRAHAVNLLLYLCAAGCVGLLGHALARACGWEHASRIGLLAAGFYAISAVGLLPVHWVAAANSPMLVALTASILCAWLHAPCARGGMRFGLLAAIPPLFAATLLSKESAVLTPLLMGVASLFAAQRPRLGDTATWFACIAIATVWLWLRALATESTASQYAFAFGMNLPRNAASLGAWLLNVPREALRMLATGDALRGAAWALAAALPALAGWLLALRGGHARLTLRQWACMIAFLLLAYAPYFPLAWNSYEYYAAVAAILPAIALARCLQGRMAVVFVALLLGVSGLVAVEGTRRLDHPGLVGRARWAEAALRELEKSPVPSPLLIQVEDEQRFYAIGAAGLAWRLGLKAEDIGRVDACPADAKNCLVFKADGRWYWSHSQDKQP